MQMPTIGRRRSVDSEEGPPAFSPGPQMPMAEKSHPSGQISMPNESDYQEKDRGLHLPGHSSHPPAYTPPVPPPSGFRIALSGTTFTPSLQELGVPPCHDLGGQPLYIGSAIFERSVHPCKLGAHLNPPCSVPYGGVEHGHTGRYDLLPFHPDHMEWVRTAHGRIPPGRRPVEGGYEENGAKLYHALGVVSGARVLGKTGEHLGGCNLPFGGGEHVLTQNYDILCWR